MFDLVEILLRKLSSVEYLNNKVALRVKPILQRLILPLDNTTFRGTEIFWLFHQLRSSYITLAFRDAVLFQQHFVLMLLFNNNDPTKHINFTHYIQIKKHDKHSKYHEG